MYIQSCSLENGFGHEGEVITPLRVVEFPPQLPVVKHLDLWDILKERHYYDLLTTASFIAAILTVSDAITDQCRADTSRVSNATLEISIWTCPIFYANRDYVSVHSLPIILVILDM